MMNVKDDNTIEPLDRIIDLAEGGRELTDEELASLMQDEDSMRAYREMLLMKTAVCQTKRCQPLKPYGKRHKNKILSHPLMKRLWRQRQLSDGLPLSRNT